jgi:peptide/nickel transport system permease protein
MATYLTRRLVHALTVLFIVCSATFVIIHAAPGGPSLLADPKLTLEERQEIERRLGLDRPIPEQYVRWISRVARGDLGDSFLYETPNVTTIIDRLPNTALLAGTALALSLVVALLLGSWCAAHPGSWVDRLISVVAFGAMAMPVFWLGILLILVFAVWLGALPAGAAVTVGAESSLGDRLRHLVLPVVVLSAATAAELLRYVRSSTRTALAQPYVRTARAKGLADALVRRRHAVRNALIPVVTVLGLQLPRLIGGAAVTETVFSWPGMGRLGVEAALSRDYPLVMAIALFVCAGVVTVSLLVDLVYLWADPRIRID